MHGSAAPHFREWITGKERVLLAGGSREDSRSNPRIAFARRYSRISRTGRAGGLAPFYPFVPAQLWNREPILSAGLLHDEIQSQDQRSRGALSRHSADSSVDARRAFAGSAESALCAGAHAGRDQRHGAREPSALRG